MCDSTKMCIPVVRSFSCYLITLITFLEVPVFPLHRGMDSKSIQVLKHNIFSPLAMMGCCALGSCELTATGFFVEGDCQCALQLATTVFCVMFLLKLVCG